MKNGHCLMNDVGYLMCIYPKSFPSFWLVRIYTVSVIEYDDDTVSLLIYLSSVMSRKEKRYQVQ